MAYACFAYAMYCSQSTFDADHAARGESCNYDAMRREIADYQFMGDSSFDVFSVDGVDVSTSASGWFGGGSDGSDGGGGGDGGDAD